MSKWTRYAPEVRDRAVRMMLEHRDEYSSQWAATDLVAGKIGCKAKTLRQWLRQADRDAGVRRGLTASETERNKQQEREVQELRQANELLRNASASFAQAELDRPFR